jgi:hypothetical protein
VARREQSSQTPCRAPLDETPPAQVSFFSAHKISPSRLDGRKETTQKSLAQLFALAEASLRSTACGIDLYPRHLAIVKNYS